MPSYDDVLPPDKSWIARKFRELERRIEQALSGRGLESSSIGAGGLTIRDGGNIRVQGGDIEIQQDGSVIITGGRLVILNEDGTESLVAARSTAGFGQIISRYPDGTTAVRIGDLTIEATGESVGQGFFFQQDDGTDIFGAGPLELGGPVTVRIQSSLGDLVFSTDVAGDGLMGRPYLDIPMYSTQADGSWSRTSATETLVARGRMFITHPFIHAQVFAWAESGTSGVIRLRVGGVGGEQIGNDETVNSTTGTFLNFGTPLRLPQTAIDAPYSFGQIVVTAERTGGSGAVIAVPYGITKRASAA